MRSAASPHAPLAGAVSCEAKLDDGLCKTQLLVQLVVTRSGHGPDDAEQDVGVLASSGWIELAEPLKPYALIARLPEPESGLSTSISSHGCRKAERWRTAAWSSAASKPNSTNAQPGTGDPVLPEL
ncbi:DUF6212 domain-containing protein (plasmid) [Phyllobacterium sp. A18/5-2]|uniref:DUF6212 domain-containing protein n=1 Tax=Phyllobacterium sp. A18/5-2 TaxID=2978392 RepID=UPI0021C974A6|nr:DUF6212 domain-containing protein [Phyllobacterium sp. A18/5-2]UXN66062.1 DUF6212 domain-containing protein [Phyllobacterium sp. A18/5-2]